MRFVWPVIWAVLWGFSFLVVGLLPGITVAIRHSSKGFVIGFVDIGLFLSIGAYTFLLCFGRLPGLRSWARDLRGFAGIGALGTIAAVIALQAGGALVIAGVDSVAQIALLPGHIMPETPPPSLLFFALCFAEIANTLWLIWMLRRLGEARLRDRRPVGIAWTPAPLRAYGVAAAAALAVCAVALGTMYLVPPDPSVMKGSSFAALANGPAWSLPLLLVIFVVAAPLVEELAFRGLAFAGFATQFGPVWAAIITSALFVTAHAPEKIHYPLGFLDVGLLAFGCCWLRVRFGSIRPGMLMHIVYNGGFIATSGLVTSLHHFQG